MASTGLSSPRTRVILDERLRLPVVGRQALADHPFGIIRAVNQLASVEVANAFALWRALVNIIDVPARLADSSARQPAHQQGRVHDHVQHDGAAQMVLLANPLQVVRLPQRARKTVEDKALGAIRLVDARPRPCPARFRRGPVRRAPEAALPCGRVPSRAGYCRETCPRSTGAATDTAARCAGLACPCRPPAGPAGSPHAPVPAKRLPRHDQP